MGAWGEAPWDNDSAADWFGDLWDRLPIVDEVHAALQSGGEEGVAALWMCSELCRIYVWPIDRYEETLRLGVASVDLLLSRGDEEQYLDLWDGQIDAQVQGFRDILAERLQRLPPPK